MAEKAKSKANVAAAIATGRRKTSVARVRFVKGKGGITVNKKKYDEYFPAGNYSMIINQPLKATEFKNDYDIFVNVYGGGLSSQAGAIRHAIARALLKLDGGNHKALKSNSFLTRDPRMVERKKYGQKKARKRFQFSKR
jgi:small subunit ribosomal protein S9